MQFYRNQIIFGQIFFELLARKFGSDIVKVKQLEEKVEEMLKVLELKLPEKRRLEISIIFLRTPVHGSYASFNDLIYRMLEKGIVAEARGAMIGGRLIWIDEIKLNQKWVDEKLLNNTEYKDYVEVIEEIIKIL